MPRYCVGDVAGEHRDFQARREALAEFHVQYFEIRDLSDRIVGIGRIRMRDRQSGVETESPLISVTDVKNGRGIRVWNYLDPKEALEAAGLSE